MKALIIKNAAKPKKKKFVLSPGDVSEGSIIASLQTKADLCSNLQLLQVKKKVVTPHTHTKWETKLPSFFFGYPP